MFQTTSTGDMGFRGYWPGASVDWPGEICQSTDAQSDIAGVLTVTLAHGSAIPAAQSCSGSILHCTQQYRFDVRVMIQGLLLDLITHIVINEGYPMIDIPL